MSDNANFSAQIQAAIDRAKKSETKYVTKPVEGAKELDPGLTYRVQVEKQQTSQPDAQKTSVQRKTGGKISLSGCKVSTAAKNKSTKNW